jgi:ABC-type Na+ efflux pump permease subunit
MCLIAAYYGIGFGTMMLPTSILVGPHMLVAALLHIGFGVVFLTAGSGRRRRPAKALGVVAAGGIIVSAGGFVAIYQSIAHDEVIGLAFWLPFALFFISMAAIAIREWLLCRRSSV